jgi:hypothetical protein
LGSEWINSVILLLGQIPTEVEFGFTSSAKHALLSSLNGNEGRDMAAKGQQRRSAKAGSDACLSMIVRSMREAGRTADAVAALLKAGSTGQAFKVALDLEPVLNDVDRALQTAAYLRRMSKA